MPEQPTPPEHAEVRYESSDARMKPIIGIGIGVGLLALLAHVICLWMFDAMRTSADRNDPQLPALAARERLKFPQDLAKVPPPQLQVNESQRLSEFRQSEDAMLSSYGWTDMKNGKVRIPVAEAMRLLANPDQAKAHGIKVVPQQPQGGKR
jgi:hypothetical protein